MTAPTARARAAARREKLAQRAAELPGPSRAARAEARRLAIVEAGATSRARQHYKCQADGVLPGRCLGPLDPHHVYPRNVRPDQADQPDAILTICRGHHRWIDAHPAEAHAAGYHGHAGDTLAELADRRDLAHRLAREDRLAGR